MSEKITLKHLAPYLPYGLKLKDHNGEIQELSVSTLSSWARGASGMWPILRPLSDLTFEDLELLGKRYEIQVEGEVVHVFRDLDENTNPTEWRHDDIQYLLSRHFDVFGLIEKGLAVDMNTLKTTQPI